MLTEVLKMDVSQVKKLNDEIEKIQVQRTKAETKKEMLLSRLKSEILEYEEVYGVKLSGKTFSDTVKLIESEYKKVTDTIKDEYSLKERVVKAIESGDIDEANKLLGITTEVETEEEDIVEDDTSEYGVDLDEEEGIDEGFDEDSEEDFDDSYEEEGTFEINDDDDFGIEMSDLEDDFDVDMKENTKKKSNNSKPNMGTKADDVVKELDGDMFGDIDDVDLDDFGFGDMLSGTKFSV